MIRLTQTGIELEGDDKHFDMMAQEWDMVHCNPVATPYVKPATSVSAFTGDSPRSVPAKCPVAASSPNGTPAKAKNPKPSPSKKEMEEGKKIGEAYRLKHLAAIKKMPASTFINAFPLKPTSTLEMAKDTAPQKPPSTQHFQMSTEASPPGTATPLSLIHI